MYINFPNYDSIEQKKRNFAAEYNIQKQKIMIAFAK